MSHSPDELSAPALALIAQGPEAVVREIASIPEADFGAGERFFMSADFAVTVAQGTLGLPIQSTWRGPRDYDHGQPDGNKRAPKIALGDWSTALTFIASLHADDGVGDKSGGWGAWCLATQAAARAAGVPWVASSYTQRLWTERTGETFESVVQ